MHVIWYTAMSMDGRIASAAGSLDFLDLMGERPGTEGEWPEFVASLDAAVVGGDTMRWLVDGGHGWPHGDLPTWLVSHDEGLVRRVGETEQPLVRYEGDLAPMFDAIEAAGHERVWLCGGGDIAGQALAAGRIDEVVATIAPVALGAGPSLFDGVELPAQRFALESCAGQGDAVRIVWRKQR